MTVSASPETDDLLIMQRIAQGDAQALRVLYERHAPICLGVCVRVLRDRDEAQQVLIDVFDEVWRSAARFDAKRGVVRGYLAMLARSRAIDRARSLKGPAMRTLLPGDLNIRDERGDNEPAASTADAERRSAVQDALAELSVEQREAVELSFFRGLTHTEIATRLDKPVGTVKTQIRQGLLRMREALRDFWQNDLSNSSASEKK